jgi:hypothetical protein
MDGLEMVDDEWYFEHGEFIIGEIDTDGEE